MESRCRGSYSGRVRRDVSEILAAELEAKIAFSSGETNRALALAREAASAEDAMTFEFGPPAVIKPAHELSGELLLELNRPAEAQAEFAAALAKAPGRLLSVRGLDRPLRRAPEGHRDARHAIG